MGSQILHVMYLHQCDWCAKKARNKHATPPTWFRVPLHANSLLFCTERCKEAYSKDKEVQALIQQKAAMGGAIHPANEVEIGQGRKEPRRYRAR